MTSVEQSIASYFLTHYPNQVGAQQVAQTLHVSPASLTRFAQKCGFKGYREFAYHYLESQTKSETPLSSIQLGLTKRVLSDYDEILSKTYSLVDEVKIQHISQCLERAKRVYFYGKGSSGMVSEEMKIRFMRIGVICEAVTDEHMLHWMDNLLDSDCLVIALSISGKTPSILTALQKAKEKGAYTVLMSTQTPENAQWIDQVLLVASAHNLSHGNRISPQFPLLIMADLLYAYFMTENAPQKEAVFQRTIIHHT